MSAAEDVNGAGFTFNGVPIDPDLYQQAARELYVYFSICLPFFFLLWSDSRHGARSRSVVDPLLGLF